MIAALFVDADGCYIECPGIDPWDVDRDAMQYTGPYPVIAHPPCERWGRFAHGSPRKPGQFKIGDDGGKFEFALQSVRLWGGVLEHPMDSQAWTHFKLSKPPRNGGWIKADSFGGWTCCVYQGHYGHDAPKATWLYTCKLKLPELIWGAPEQRLSDKMIERHGYEVARRRGIVSLVGGKFKKRLRDATPIPFRDLLISMVRNRVKR